MNPVVCGESNISFARVHKLFRKLRDGWGQHSQLPKPQLVALSLEVGANCTPPPFGTATYAPAASPVVMTLLGPWVQDPRLLAAAVATAATCVVAWFVIGVSCGTCI